LLFSGGGLPPMVSQTIQSDMVQNSAQQDGARSIPVTPGQVTPGDQQLVQAVEGFVQPGELFNYRFQLKMSDKLKKPVVQVIDKQTGAEICEIPPDTVIQMLVELRETKGGTIVDRKV